MRFPKRVPVRSPKIRAAARDQDCTLRLPGCRNDGKGGAQKADDDKGAFGCFHCHDLLDGRARWPGLTKEMIEMEFTRAVEETRAILAAKGLL